MQKSELLEWLHAEYQQWAVLLAKIGPGRMEQPGVNGDWSMKDVVGHLNGWNRWLVARFQASEAGKSAPPPPWPEHLQNDDDINAWIYASGRASSLAEVLAETQQLHQRLLAAIEALPDDTRIDSAYRVVWIDDQKLSASEFFDHFHDDHESDVRAWLARIEQE